MLSNNCKVSLVLQAHSEGSLDELEEVDLNSPIKKTSNRIFPIKPKKLSLEHPSHLPPRKKKKRNRRDLK